MVSFVNHDGTQFAEIKPRIRATELHKSAAVKSPLGAQTVLGDRHDPVYEILLQAPSGGLRNSPERTFQRLGTQTDSSQ